MKITVNVAPRAVTALDQAREITGDSRTDVINRALQVYAFLMDKMDEGREVWIHDPATGTARKVVLM